MNPELLQIPKRIRELREILDLSTIEVAEKLGVTLDEYQRYESGEQDIPSAPCMRLLISSARTAPSCSQGIPRA